MALLDSGSVMGRIVAEFAFDDLRKTRSGFKQSVKLTSIAVAITAVGSYNARVPVSSN